MNTTRKSTKIITTLFASQSLLSASTIMIFTVSSILVVRLTGGNSDWTGVPSFVTMIGAALIAYPIGSLMDRYGRRIGLSLGHFLGAVGSAIAAWAVFSSSLVLFLVGIFFIGLARGAIELGRYAAAEASPPKLRARAISLVVFGGTVGSIAGPTLIKLSENLSNRYDLPEFTGPWVIAGALFLVGILVLNLFLHPDPSTFTQAETDELSDEEKQAITKNVRSFRTLLREPRMQLAIAAMLMSQLSMVIVMTVTPIHMDGHQHGITAISWVITGHTLGMFAFSFFTGWLTDKVGRSSVIFVGGLILVLGGIVSPLSTKAFPIGVGLFLVGLGWNFCYVAGSSLLNDILRPGEKGRFQGTVDMIVRIGAGISSLASGLMFKRLDFTYTSWITILISLIPVILVLTLKDVRDNPST